MMMGVYPCDLNATIKHECYPLKNTYESVKLLKPKLLVNVVYAVQQIKVLKSRSDTDIKYNIWAFISFCKCCLIPVLLQQPEQTQPEMNTLAIKKNISKCVGSVSRSLFLSKTLEYLVHMSFYCFK